MLLADFTPVRVGVEDYKGTLRMTVRGVSLDDVALLIRSHLGDLQQLYDMLQDGTLDVFALLIADGFILKLLVSFPELAARLIAVAADEPEATAQARKLPLPLQIKAIQTIMRLTFEDVGGPKVFAALVRELIREMLGKTPGAAPQTMPTP